MKIFLYLIHQHQDAESCVRGIQLDIYQKPCPLGCKYCWAMQSGVPPKELVSFNTADEFLSFLANPIKFLSKQKLDKQTVRYLASSIMRKIPLRIGSHRDPLVDNPTYLANLYSLIQSLNHAKYYHFFVTKLPLTSLKQIIDIIDPVLCKFHVSMSSLDPELIRKYESATPLPDERLHGIQLLRERKIDVVVRASPFFEKTDAAIKSFVGTVKTAGASGIIMGFLSSENKLEQNVDLSLSGEEKNILQIANMYTTGQGLFFSFCYLGRESVSRFLWKTSACKHDCCQLNEANLKITLRQHLRNFSDRSLAFLLKYLQT